MLSRYGSERSKPYSISWYYPEIGFKTLRNDATIINRSNNFIRLIYLFMLYLTTRSRDSSVGITTGYGIDGRGSNPGKGKIFFF
jgi:hypothetical protein